MKATAKAKKVMKKTEKAAKKAVKQVTRKASGLAKKAAKIKGKVEKKLETQKDAVIQKLKEELAEKESRIRKSAATLKEAIDQAGKEISEFKDRTSQSLLALKEKAEVEARKLKEEMEAKTQGLRKKVTELEEYKKTAEARISGLQGKAKEFAGRVLPPEKERTGLVTFKGNPLTLLGQEVKVGDRAPNFQVVDKAMQRVTLESFKGKVKIITAVPSLDTPVCDTETHRFNEEAGKLPEKAVILTISMDLPFAQARWCAAAGVEKVQTFSDYRDRSFGSAYGVLIKELELLARSVFVVDDQDVIRYAELIPEITQQPDYDRVINAARALL
jgi:thiol peroxidase